jgi:hypothetical protein
MVVQFNLTALRARIAIIVLAIAGSALLLIVIVSRFVIGTLGDYRVQADRDTLQVPASYFPNSARLNARLASAELSEKSLT